MCTIEDWHYEISSNKEAISVFVIHLPFLRMGVSRAKENCRWTWRHCAREVGLLLTGSGSDWRRDSKSWNVRAARFDQLEALEIRLCPQSVQIYKNLQILQVRFRHRIFKLPLCIFWVNLFLFKLFLTLLKMWTFWCVSHCQFALNNVLYASIP